MVCCGGSSVHVFIWLEQEHCSEVMVERGAFKANAPPVDAALAQAVSPSTVATDVLFLAYLYRNLQVFRITTMGCMYWQLDHFYMKFLCLP